jgi:hypothetical protein
MRREFFLLILVFVGCNRVRSAATWTKGLLTDPPPPPPLSIVLACDHSTGSTCGQVELAANIDVTLLDAARRPHSTIALWVIGGDVGSTRELTHVDVPDESTRGDRARAAQQRTWIEASRAELLRASKAIFSVEPTHASPLAAAISAISLSRPGSTIVLITDGLESTRETFDFECKKLPDAHKLLARFKNPLAARTGIACEHARDLRECTHHGGRREPLPDVHRAHRGRPITLECCHHERGRHAHYHHRRHNHD